MSKKILLLCIFIYAKGFAMQFTPVDSFEIRMVKEQKITEAIQNGDEDKILKYIKSGLDINKRFWDGSTFLCDAIRYKQPEMIKLLLELKADPNLRTAPFKNSNDEWIPEDSPLETAIVFDSDFFTARLLLKYGANINDTDFYYGTLLHEVISGKGDMMISGRYSENNDSLIFRKNQAASMKKVQWLIKNGANVNQPDPNGNSPLYKALDFGYYDIAELLIDNGASVNINTRDGKGLLHLVESQPFLSKLINLGSDVNARTESGLTPLHFAVFSENYKKAKLLVENNADVNAKDYDSHLTPLGWLIVDSFNTEIARLLISHGAEIPDDLVKQYGWTIEIEKIKKELKR